MAARKNTAASLPVHTTCGRCTLFGVLHVLFGHLLLRTLPQHLRSRCMLFFFFAVIAAAQQRMTCLAEDSFGGAQAAGCAADSAYVGKCVLQVCRLVIILDGVAVVTPHTFW